MVAVLKTAVSLCGTVGSNPTPSVFAPTEVKEESVNRSAGRVAMPGDESVVSAPTAVKEENVNRSVGRVAMPGRKSTVSVPTEVKEENVNRSVDCVVVRDVGKSYLHGEYRAALVPSIEEGGNSMKEGG